MSFFKRLGKGQPILGAEDRGPVQHIKKQGTPTMGGIAIMFSAAFEVPQTISAVQATNNGQVKVMPGRSARVNESVSLTPVAAVSHQVRPMQIANVM
ncbi:MAG: hypothetical protein ACKOQX_11235 [Actinomycetota bacterium]